LVFAGSVRYYQSVVTRKYPLDPLRRVREDTVDRRVRAVSDALGATEKARRDAELAEARKRELEQTVDDTMRGEHRRLDAGDLTVADLARGAAWNLAAHIEQSRRRAALDAAREKQLHAEAVAREERRLLIEAEKAARVVSKHHEAWQAQRKSAVVAAEDEQAEESYLARRNQRGER
jgi:hypothetical protein